MFAKCKTLIGGITRKDEIRLAHLRSLIADHLAEPAQDAVQGAGWYAVGVLDLQSVGCLSRMDVMQKPGQGNASGVAAQQRWKPSARCVSGAGELLLRYRRRP